MLIDAAGFFGIPTPRRKPTPSFLKPEVGLVTPLGRTPQHWILLGAGAWKSV